MKLLNAYHMGWQCPLCETVWSPSVTQCLACSPSKSSGFGQASDLMPMGGSARKEAHPEEDK